MIRRRTRLDRLSLGTKITIVGLTASAAALLIASAALIGLELWTYKPSLEREMRRFAEVVAANASAAVLFNDRAAIAENLSVLEHLTEVHYAVVLDAAGDVVATYPSEGEADSAAARTARFEVRAPIVVEPETVGELRILVGFEGLSATIRRYVLIVLAVFLCSFLIAYAATRVLKPIALRPIVDLGRAMRSIRDSRDYSANVIRFTDDEFGALADSFNLMLEEIRRREEGLARAAEEMALAKEAAEQANEAKTRFFANMSHELRTPLNAIIGYAEIVIEELEEDDRASEVADMRRIVSAAHHLLGLINEVLDVAKMEAGRLDLAAAPTDLAPLLSSAVETVKPLADKNKNELIVEIEPGLGVAVVDSTRLRQCILNLLSNACKFTKSGRVSLTAAAAETAEGRLLKVVVRDTGIGITREQLGRLFMPFVQVDGSTTRQFGGTGLGLAITRSLSQLMGGDVAAESEAGRGSVFTLTIPYSPPERREEDEAETEPPVSTRAGSAACAAPARRVLIIDDQSDVRALVRRRLEREGLAVAEAAGCAEGLDAARREPPDLILLDVMLPDGEGWFVLDAAAADPKLRDVPVVMLTISDDRAAGLAGGAAEHLVKPIGGVELTRMVRAFLPPRSERVAVLTASGETSRAVSALRRAGHAVDLFTDAAAAAAVGDRLGSRLVIDESVDGLTRDRLGELSPETEFVLFGVNHHGFARACADRGRSVAHAASIGQLLLAIAASPAREAVS